jgi:hypothetical protein
MLLLAFEIELTVILTLNKRSTRYYRSFYGFYCLHNRLQQWKPKKLAASVAYNIQESLLNNPAMSS